MCAPGCTCGRHKVTEAKRERARQLGYANKGKKKSAEHRAIMIQNLKPGLPCLDGCTCPKHSEESRQRARDLGKSRKGIKRPPEHTPGRKCQEGCICNRHSYEGPKGPKIVVRDNKPEDLAWAAGFLDGEGCFTLVKYSKPKHPMQRSVHVSASQTRLDPLDFLVELFGGRVGKTSQTSTGNDIFMWRIGEARIVEAMIPLVLPYLRVKKREAEIVLSYASTIQRRGRPSRTASSFVGQEEIDLRSNLIDELKIIRNR